MRRTTTLHRIIYCALSLFIAQTAWAWSWMQCPGGGNCKWSGMPQDFYADSNTFNSSQYLLAGLVALTWESEVDTHYDLRYYDYRNSSGSALDYKNTIHNYDIESDCGGCSAWTLIWVLSSSQNTVRDVDIEMNTQESWYVGTGTCPSNKLDYWSILAHEYGHMALCGHSSYSTAIMKPGLGYGGMRRSFTTDDDTCLIYGESIGAYGN